LVIEDKNVNVIDNRTQQLQREIRTLREEVGKTTALKLESTVKSDSYINPICPKCGTKNSEKARFCNSCGAELEKNPPPERTCPSCGAKNEEGARFCNSCGVQLPEKDITNIVMVIAMNDMVTCPLCNASQKSNRNYCNKCKVKFEYNK
jgi:predicted amidophosphoribosyltransferase